MTLTEQESFVKNLIAEDVVDANSNINLASAAQLDQFIDQANKKWWRKVAALNRRLLTIRSADTTYSATTHASGYDYSGAILNANGVLQIVGVYNKISGSYYEMEDVSADSRSTYEPTQPAPSLSDTYFIEAEKIVLTPPPGADQTLQILYVPRLPTLGASTECLGGKLTDFHPIVGYDAALSMLRKDGAKDATLGAFKAERQELWNDLQIHLRARQNPGGRKIRHVPYD